MNKRTLRLEKYGITGKRYKELCGFCEQYPDWKMELEASENYLKGNSIDGMPKPPAGHSSDSTAQEAMRKLDVKKKVDLIEKTAKRASEDLWTYIIKSVCYEQPFWYIRDIMKIPCSERCFYDSRRYFFFLLDKEKKVL